jgi:hypothetical protein
MTEPSSYQLSFEEAISHFFCVVDADGKGLSSIISKYVRRGSFFAIAPIGTSYRRLLEFRQGGLVTSSDREDSGPPIRASQRDGEAFAVPIPDLAEAMATVICSRRRNIAIATVFIREPYLTSLHKSDITSELIKIGTGLYKAIPAKVCNTSNLTQDIRRFQVPWSFLLILSNVDKQERNIEDIIANADTMAVNAYDGESYLYWLRS